MPSARERRPKDSCETLTAGPRLYITAGDYATSSYKQCFVKAGAGDDGYAGKGNSVHVGMKYKDSNRFYTTRVSILSTIPRDLLWNKSGASDMFLNKRDKATRKTFKAMGDVGRGVARFAKKNRLSDGHVKDIIKHVIFRMYRYYKDLIPDDAEDDNSEAGIRMLPLAEAADDDR